MRYDKKVYFIRRSQPEYNPDTGNYEYNDPETVCEAYASVQDAGMDIIQNLYGEYKSGSKIIQIQRNEQLKAFDLIQYNQTYYKIDMVRQLRHKTVFICTEKTIQEV